MDDFRGKGYEPKDPQQKAIDITKYLERAEWLVSKGYILDQGMTVVDLARKIQKADPDFSVIEEVRSRIVPPR